MAADKGWKDLKVTFAGISLFEEYDVLDSTKQCEVP